MSENDVQPPANLVRRLQAALGPLFEHVSDLTARSNTITALLRVNNVSFTVHYKVLRVTPQGTYYDDSFYVIADHQDEVPIAIVERHMADYIQQRAIGINAQRQESGH